MTDTPDVPDPERNRLSGRLARTAKVGANLSGAGISFAANSLFGGDQGDERIAKALAAALGRSKGPLMKVAQMVSTIPDFLPAEYAAELGQLQAQAPAMGWPFVKRRMRAELGPDWLSLFNTFRKDASHAASLGQVHDARMHDGRRVACKLQYPDMSSAVESDVGQLKAMLGLFKRMDGSIDLTEMVGEVTDRLREELDYGREAKHMALYAGMLTDKDFVQVPEPVPELSTDRLLTMTWLDGERLDAFEGAAQETRDHIAEMLFWTWWGPFNGHAVIHGDPHLGNYQVTGGGSGINLLDFGCIRVFPPSFVRGVIELYNGLCNDDPDLALQAYETWGFTGLNKETIEVLNIWARFVYAPLMEDKVQKIQESESGMYGASIANKVHEELRRLGGVTPPREFVLMDRAAIGLGSVFMHLRAEVNWHRMFHELIGDFDQDTLAQRQSDALEKAGVPEAA